MAMPLPSPPTPGFEGDCLSSLPAGLPDFNVGIDYLTLLTEVTPRRSRVEKVATYLATMSDGSLYTARDYYPSKAFDRTVDMTTPLGTRITGFNDDLCMDFAEAGNHVRIFGFNQAEDHPTSLAQDAFTYTQLIQALNEKEGIIPGQRASINFGESRGGMCGWGMMAYANLFGEIMDLGIHVDDCLPEETDTAMTVRGLPPHNAVKELFVASRAFRRQPAESRIAQIKRARRWSRSISLTPSFVKAQIHSGQALWSGEAGTFIDHLSDEQAIVLHAFNRNRLNGRDSYENKLRRLPYGRIVDEDKWHMDLSRYEVTHGSTVKLVTAQRELQAGSTPGEIIDLLTEPFFTKVLATS